MPRPVLTDQQTEAALNAYYANREQAVRYVLAQLDPLAFDAPARPYAEVLTRVQELLTAEIGRYAEAPAAVPTPDTPSPEGQEEAAHG